MKSIPRCCRLAFLLLIPLTCLHAAESVLVQASPDAGLVYSNPVWSPNGRNVAYVAVGQSDDSIVSRAKASSVYVASLSGGNWKHRLLAKGADHPVWSPDGKRLALHQGGLAIVDAGTGKGRLVVKDVEGSEGQSQMQYPIAWSPNGKYLLYQTAYYEGSSAFVLDVASGTTRKLTAGADGVWTADGKLLSFSSVYGEVPRGSDQLWLRTTDPATGKFTTNLRGIAVAQVFAPKRSSYAWVLLRQDPPNGQGIYEVDLKKGSLVKLISMRAEVLQWSPDGKQFAFIAMLSMKPDQEPKANLYVGNTHNWYFKTMSKQAAKPSGNWHDRMSYIGWAPDSKSVAYVTETGDIRIIKL